MKRISTDLYEYLKNVAMLLSRKKAQSTVNIIQIEYSESLKIFLGSL